MSVSRDIPVLLVLVLTDLWILWDTVSVYPAVCTIRGTPCTLTAGQYVIIAGAAVILVVLVVHTVRTLFDTG
jgi:hypothetical protein